MAEAEATNHETVNLLPEDQLHSLTDTLSLI